MCFVIKEWGGWAVGDFSKSKGFIPLISRLSESHVCRMIYKPGKKNPEQTRFVRKLLT
jgi:hypothetical protein